jgi:hypothetical protein
MVCAYKPKFLPTIHGWEVQSLDSLLVFKRESAECTGRVTAPDGAIATLGGKKAGTG